MVIVQWIVVDAFTPVTVAEVPQPLDAVTIFKETGDRHREGGSLNNLGLALDRAGRVEEAITAHQDAVAIFRETGDRHSEGMALNNLEMNQTSQQT